MSTIGYNSKGMAIGANQCPIEPENFKELVKLIEEAESLPRQSNIINMDKEDYILGLQIGDNLRNALKLAKQLRSQTKGKYVKK